MSRVKVTELRGEILSATEDELREIIRLLDTWPSSAEWFSTWASGRHQAIGDARDLMRTVPATPAAVIAYFHMFFREK